MDRQATSYALAPLAALRARSATLARIAALDNGLRPYPFQADGAAKLSTRRAHLLADDMGLGKTIQALIALPERARAIVICPASVEENWRREILKWRPDLRPLPATRGIWTWPEPGEVRIARWSALPEACAERGTEEDPHTHSVGCFAASLPAPPDGVICVLDEVHYAKSAGAARTKKVRAIISRAFNAGGSVWGLTGTPLPNTPRDLWEVLRTLARISQILAPSWYKFADRFFERDDRTGHAVAAGRELAPALARVMTRRTKAEVLPDLPPKRYETLPISFEEPLLRKQLDDGVAELGGEAHISAVLAGALGAKAAMEMTDHLSSLRALLALVKAPAALEYVAEYEAAGEPIVVFACHKKPIHLLGEREGWGTITGETPREDRAGIIDEFQAGRLKGLAVTTAACEGITLTRAATLLRIDWDWRPAINRQIEDRLCRIGQERMVRIVDMVADHAIDRIVHGAVVRKEGVLEGAGLLG